MKKNIFIGLCLLFLSLGLAARDASALDGRTNRSSHEQDADPTLGLVSGYLKGNSTYHISIYSGTSGVESELEFPLKTFLAGIEASFGSPASSKDDGFKINIKWLKNIGDGSGKMKDSDWLTDDQDILLVGSPHPGKDIYSESDISLSAQIFDIQIAFSNHPRPDLSIGPFGGFKYEYFHYDVSNLQQVGYGPYALGYTGSVSGKVLDYEVTYTMFYVGAHAELAVTKDFQAGIKLGFSPTVSAKDTDDHILRYKKSKGDTTGQAYMADISGEWDLGNNDFFRINGNYMKINTTGTQTQTWYYAPNPDGVPAGFTITGINDKITSTQSSVMLTFTHRF